MSTTPDAPKVGLTKTEWTKLSGFLGTPLAVVAVWAWNQAEALKSDVSAAKTAMVATASGVESLKASIAEIKQEMKESRKESRDDLREVRSGLEKTNDRVRDLELGKSPRETQ